MKIVDAVKAELKMPNLKVNLQPVTSGNRIPLLQTGNIDLECGSTTNSVERQKQVSFGPTYFVINVTAAVKKNSGIKTLADLNGKTISTTSGTTSVPLLKQVRQDDERRHQGNLRQGPRRVVPAARAGPHVGVRDGRHPARRPDREFRQSRATT